MISVIDLLAKCPVDVLNELHEQIGRVMAHMEFLSGKQGVELAKECEEYWQVYRLNHLIFAEIIKREKQG